MTLAKVTRHTVAGTTFLSCDRTAAHLSWTVAELKRVHPFARLLIIQPCYNTGVSASAGTHDYDAVFDVKIDGLGWWDAQLFLRRCGWAAWFRHDGLWASPKAWHIHMASIPEGLDNTPTPLEIGKAYAAAGIKVGRYIDGGYTTGGSITTSSQVDDYFAHAIGLKGQHQAGADKSRFPGDIAATIYRYQEDEVPYQDWPQADKDALAADVAAALRKELFQTIDPKTGARVDEHFASVIRTLDANVEAIKKKVGA